MLCAQRTGMRTHLTLPASTCVTGSPTLILNSFLEANFQKMSLNNWVRFQIRERKQVDKFRPKKKKRLTLDYNHQIVKQIPYRRI